MKLFKLLKNLNCRVLGNSAIEIDGLYHKDTEVNKNGLFFCLRGTRVDGNNFVFSAIKNGAVAIVVEQEIQNLSGITQIIVKNAREAMSLIACKFFGYPSEKLKIIGVTGTNGKTTTTNMIASVLKTAGKKVAIVGTNGVFIKNIKYETNMTTPDPIELQKYLAIMVKSKIEYVCAEISAHAIDLHKIDGVKFEVVIFSNLTEDHLDYFKTMENYFEAKARLFSKKYAKIAVLNEDDFYSKRLIDSISLPYITYSKVNDKSDFFAKVLSVKNGYQNLKINNDFELRLPMLGGFNVSNAISAIATLKILEISKEDIVKGLENMKQVDGRFNSYLINGITVVIDYAHTPDGLKNILMTAKEIAKNNKLICVFGCGGNRDYQKRPIMGSIASEMADYSIITTDNPRFESAEKIAEEIACGFIKDNYEIEIDRSAAIKKAISMATNGDIVVLAGKGAENYIEENGIKIPYSDLSELEKIRRNLWMNFCLL